MMHTTLARQVVFNETTTPAGQALGPLLVGATPVDLVLAQAMGGDWPARLRHIEARLIECAASSAKIEAMTATLALTGFEEAGRCLGELLSIVQRRGGRCLNVRFPDLYGQGGVDPFDRYQSSFNHVFHLLSQSRFEAEAAGVSVALEVAWGGFLLSPVEARELIDSANSWSVGACVDLVTLGDELRALDWLHTLRGRVRCVRTTDPQDAALNKALEAAGFDGTIVALG